jgi:SAM-dependent methyltransferase
MGGNVIDPSVPHLGGNIVGGDTHSFCPELWKYLVQKYDIRSVLDVGCGEGYAMREFRRLGCETIGIEGLRANSEKCPAPVVIADLSVIPVIVANVDLVWCCEVVEHVAPESVENLLKTMICGKILAMTHATPGKIGYHHVNCQPPEYWIAQLSRHGMTFDFEASMEARSHCQRDSYFGNTGMIFKWQGS